MYTFSSQSDTKSGVYPITAKIFDINNNLLSTDTCSVSIQKYRKLEIIALDFPENTKEGDTLKIRYLLQNLGNNQENIMLKIEEGSFDNVKDTLTLEAKASIELTYRRIIPQKPLNYWVFNSYIKVVPIDTTIAFASISQSISIYSTTLKKTDLYLRLPIDVGLLYNGFVLGNKQIGGYQFDIRGKGYIGFDNKHHLDFILHGPNNFQVPMIGSYDFYSLRYNYKKNTQINVGDYTLRFNNLMEFGRFGRGFSFEQKLNKNQLMAFVSIPRFSQNEKFEAGGSYQTHPNKNLHLSFNYMFKKLLFFGINEININLIGISTNYSKSNLHIETELSTGLSKSKLDFGFYNQLIYQGKRLNFNNISVYAGKDFHGFYTNSIAIINSLGFNINKVLNVTINNNFNRLNPSFDLINYNTSPLSNSYSVFLGFRLNQSNNISLGYNILEREDRFEPKSFNYRDDFGSFNFKHTSKRISVNLVSRYGSTLNRLVSKDNNQKSVFIANSFDSEVKIFQWLSVGALLDQQRTSKFSLNNEVRDLYYYGGKVRLNINKFLNVFVSYRNGFAPDELTTVANSINTSAEFNFENHSLGISGGKTIFPKIPNLDLSDKNLIFFNIKYTFRLNAPIAKNKNLGSIKGQLSGFSNGMKKDGIIIQLGERRTMSDTSGTFYFNNLLPDTYIVNFDKTTMKKGLNPILKFPLKVEVKSDSTKVIKIALTKTGGIEGKVEFMKGSSIADEYKEKPTLIIKLTNDKEIFYTQLNKSDAFSFKEMKPDNWKLIAYFPYAAEKFSIVNGEQSVTINADSMRFVVITVKPIIKKINFSSNNFNLVAKNEGKVKQEEVKKVTDIQPITELKADSISSIIKTKALEETGPIKAVLSPIPLKLFEGIKVSLIKISKIKVASNIPKGKYLLIIFIKPNIEIKTVQTYVLPLKTEKRNSVYNDSDDSLRELKKEDRNR